MHRASYGFDRPGAIDAAIRLQRHEVTFKSWLVGENKRRVYQVPIAYESDVRDEWLAIAGSYRLPTKRPTGDFGGAVSSPLGHVHELQGFKCTLAFVTDTAVDEG